MPDERRAGDLDFSGSETVRLPPGELDQSLIEALADVLPDGANFGFNYDDSGAWVRITRPHDTREFVDDALRRVGRKKE